MTKSNASSDRWPENWIMALPLACALEATDGARQQLRDGAERNVQHLGDLAVPQPIVAQMETLALTFGQRVEHAP
jgi:hypothetical protein